MKKFIFKYFFISPHSAHPPGVPKGLIIADILRIYHLSCSWPSLYERAWTN